MGPPSGVVALKNVLLCRQLWNAEDGSRRSSDLCGGCRCRRSLTGCASPGGVQVHRQSAVISPGRTARRTTPCAGHPRRGAHRGGRHVSRSFGARSAPKSNWRARRPSGSGRHTSPRYWRSWLDAIRFSTSLAVIAIASSTSIGEGFDCAVRLGYSDRFEPHRTAHRTRPRTTRSEPCVHQGTRRVRDDRRHSQPSGAPAGHGNLAFH